VNPSSAIYRHVMTILILIFSVAVVFTIVAAIKGHHL
jgi:hypothetical protein